MKNIFRWMKIQLKNQITNDYHQIFEKNSQPIIVLSPEGTIIQCNAAALSLYPLSASDFLNKDYFSSFHQHNFQPAFSSLENMRKTRSTSTTTIVEQKKGIPKIIQWTTTIFARENIPGYICLQGFDITTVSNISINAKKLQDSIIDHLPSHFIFWKDTNSVYLGCNEAFSASLGFQSPNEIIGKTDYDLPVKKESSAAYIADDKEVMVSKIPKLNIEEAQILKNGETKILLTSKVPLINDQGDVYGVLAIYSDITQQKRNEAQLVETNQKLEESYRVKSEFIRNMSHDIRTPLSGIQQTVRAMSDGIIPEADIPEYAFAVWEASNKLMELFNKIIDVSKNDQFGFEDNVVKFDLYELLNGIKKTYNVIAKHKNILLEIEYAHNVPQYLLGKHFRLHRILMNLMGNALKFTEKGSVKLLAETASETDEQVILRFSVIDTGIGIAEKNHGFIFEPFSRLTPSSKGQYPGSGLGLHVVKDYVAKMQGEIYLESAEGEGSLFSCVLPFKLPMLKDANDLVEIEYPEETYIKELMPLKKLSHFAKPVTTGHDKLKKYRVLLVEDYELAQSIGVLILNDLGYQVDIAKSGEEAIELTEKHPYNLIYVDIGLPGIDGIETVKRIRGAQKNPNKNTFIAALTAHADEGISDQCLQAGMQEVIFKPLSPEKAQQVHQILFPSDKDLNTTPVIDYDLWRMRLGSNAEKLAEFFHLLANDLPIQKNDLEIAYEKHDLNALKSVVHKIKGGVRYCGCPDLESAILALENAVKNNNSAAISAGYHDAMDAIDAVMDAYHTFLAP